MLVMLHLGNDVDDWKILVANYPDSTLPFYLIAFSFHHFPSL